jgi:hypothetical protein
MSFPRTVADALVLARLAFERGVDILPPGPRQPVADTFEEYRRDPRGSLKRKEAEVLFNHGSSKQIEVEKDREVDSFLDGSSRRITTKSAYLRKAALLILAFPPDGLTPKARQPAQSYQKRPRPRTTQELRGLAEGNRQRAEAARQRREAKVADRV